MDYLIVGFSWVVYLAVHSLLASTAIKKTVREKAGWFWPFYRFFYSVVSIVGLLWIFLILATTPSHTLFDPPGYLRYIGMIFASWGVILMVVSFRYLSGLQFMGIKKPKTGELVTKGLHAFVRHPLYSGNILMLVGLILNHPTDMLLLSTFIIFAYFPIGIYFEEKKLVEEFGEAYVEYSREVPAIFPKIRL
ncbi:MAG: isoprenylcysteine carboxylmethyltransferase family protein [Marinoscillum sp.]